MIIELIDGSNIDILVDKAIYSSEVVHKCFYWYGGSYEIDIIEQNDSFVIKLKGCNLDEKISEISKKVKSDLVDFKTRDIISKETRNVRDLLIAKAFATSEDFDEIPPGNANDQVGFDPESF